MAFESKLLPPGGKLSPVRPERFFGIADGHGMLFRHKSVLFFQLMTLTHNEPAKAEIP